MAKGARRGKGPKRRLGKKVGVSAGRQEVEGRYKIKGMTVKVTVTDRPTLASWSTVESKAKDFFR